MDSSDSAGRDASAPVAGRRGRRRRGGHRRCRAGRRLRRRDGAHGQLPAGHRRRGRAGSAAGRRAAQPPTAQHADRRGRQPAAHHGRPGRRQLHPERDPRAAEGQAVRHHQPDRNGDRPQRRETRPQRRRPVGLHANRRPASRSEAPPRPARRAGQARSRPPGPRDVPAGYPGGGQRPAQRLRRATCATSTARRSSCAA